MIASVLHNGSGGGGSHLPPSPPCDGGTTINYYRRFPADYANDTRHLNFTEHGAYTLLLDWCYANQRPLPRKREDIYRKMCARSDEERKAIDTVLGEFFEPSKIGFTHRRVQKEIDRMNAISAQASINGIKGNEIKSAKASQWRRSETREGVASQKLEARSYTLEPDKPKTTHIPFVAPTLEQVSSYMQIRGIEDPQGEASTFIDHHAQRKWKVSGGRGPIMSDWQAAVRTWQSYRKKFGGNRNGRTRPITAQDHIDRAIRNAEILGLTGARKPS